MSAEPRSTYTKQGLRIIRTARTPAAINKAAGLGFRPVLVRVKSSGKIRQHISVWQNTYTGEILELCDPRQGPLKSPWNCIFPSVVFYPHNFPSPFAAYLIPPDTEKGETVWVEDVIEDFVEMTWGGNLGVRLESSSAVWSGRTIKILFDKKRPPSILIG